MPALIASSSVFQTPPRQMALRQEQPKMAGMFSRPPVFTVTSLCCNLVKDQLPILFGSTSRRHRFPRLQAIRLSHSRTSLDRNRWQLSEGKLRILPPVGVGQMPFDQFSEPESLVQFAHPDQAAVGSDAGILEGDFERDVEGELKGLIFHLTHWVLTSGLSSSRSHVMNIDDGNDSKIWGAAQNGNVG
jgi:hypothetical protein